MATVVEKLNAAANTMQAELNTIGGAIENLAQDIANLNGKLAAAGTPEQVDEILNPHLTRLKELSAAMVALKDVVPDAPAEPPVDPPPQEPL